MSNATTASAAVSSSNAPTAAEDSASTITVNTKTPAANFPPPKTDKPRPHVCATCQRSFARLEHLKRHERSHTKEKPFECPECARCFARRDLLLRHQQKLHQTSTPSSRPRNRRESASGGTPAQNRRKNSVAGVNAAAASNSAAAPMRPRANTISHVDGAAMQMLAASANASSAPRGPMAHSRHTSLMGLPVHHLDHVFGGMASVLGQRGLQHRLPKLETSQMVNDDFNISGLRTAPPMAIFNPELDFEGLFFGPGSTINPNALHYNDSPQSMALDQTSSFGHNLADVASSQHFDESLDWVIGFEHQMTFNTNENVIDGSSPSAISTTSQSGISDVMVDGSNHPTPAATSTMWQPSLMGPPQMPNPFAMDLNGSVFPDLLSGAPCSPQPATQKINDPYFSAPPTSLSSSSNPLVSGMKSRRMNNPSLGTHANPDTPSSLNGENHHHHTASPVTTITDATRTTIVTILSHCVPFGGRKHSFSLPSSMGTSAPPLPPPSLPSSSSHVQSSSGGNNNNDSSFSSSVPSVQNLQRYVQAYLTCFHPHLPFLHLPTLCFDVPPGLLVHQSTTCVSGNGCLLLSMAAFGAAYEMEPVQSKELFEMAKKMVFFYLEERRQSDVRKADTRRSTISTDSRNTSRQQQQQQHEQNQQSQAPLDTPLWLVQAMLLNVMYGHTCSDKITGDIASTHFSALVSLSQSADPANLGKDVSMSSSSSRNKRDNDKDNGPSDKDGSGDNVETVDLDMLDESGWEQHQWHQQQNEWLEWKNAEEYKRTVYVIFILSSLAVSSFNHSPAMTNSEISLDLPCDEEFFAADSSSAFAGKGGAEAANHNRLTFYDSLGELLCTNERQQKQQRQQHQEQLTDMKPSTFGCLILIYALHNYMWETRQRHQERTWTYVDYDKMRRHMEPALKAWQVAWSGNPQHSIERPNPFGLGPMCADAIPLLDLAYVKLFVDFGPAKEKLWQRDWQGMMDELSRACEAPEPEETNHSPPSTSELDGTEQSSSRSPFTQEGLLMGLPSDSSDSQSYPDGGMAADAHTAFGASHDNDDVGRRGWRHERCLRMASYYAVDSLCMSSKLGATFADRISHELPMQTVLCTAECAHVLAAWTTVVQDRVGPYIGVMGQDAIDFGQMPAAMLLEEEDMKLLSKIEDVLSTAEAKIGTMHQQQQQQQQQQVSTGGGGGGIKTSPESILSPDGFNGYATKILRLAAWMAKRSAVWPIAQVAAHGLEMYANHVRGRAERSVLRNL
ncbi:hypothetical protein E4U43_003693 [Claviceps pusilla]|uniref:C2H2-type domain-containing protein n=1 Tax=Claviceps pusilla TaxID=123648 RepID=A0A9P7NGB4_9HYPO|nr:hypothetical protein E4U43_003693 [Claviceps pusilla]